MRKTAVWYSLLLIIISGRLIASPESIGHHSHAQQLFGKLPASIGHKGAGKLCPGNTLACYQKALALGASALEADLQVLGDGELVMFHDDNALRQTGVNKALIEFNLQEFKLLNLSIGYNQYNKLNNHKDSPYPATQALSFKEFLQAFPNTPILLDVKPESDAMADALYSFVQREFTTKNLRNVYIKSNSLWLPGKLRKLTPRPKVALSRYERIMLLYWPGLIDELPPSWIDLEPQYLSNKVVQWAQQKGHIITSSTIDDKRQMQSLLQDYALDGLVSNRPDLFSQLQKARQKQSLLKQHQ